MNNTVPTDDVWTVQRILERTTRYLTARGVESARLEADLLCAHARKCPRIRLYTDLDVPMGDQERARMRDYVRQRAARVPLAYITGHREFYGRRFAVGRGVMIPRPETETLIDLALEQISDDRATKIYEVGFGSGCVAITLAAQKPLCRIVACDISEVCRDYAQKNAATHTVTGQVQFIQGSGLRAISDAAEGRPCDVVVSNPPYVCEHEIEHLDPDIVNHEPRIALVSGPDGLDVIRTVLSEAAGTLRPGGWIGLECDPDQCASVVELMSQSGFVASHVHKDYRAVDRIVTAVLEKSSS